MNIYRFAKILSLLWLLGAVSLFVKGVRFIGQDYVYMAIGFFLGLIKYRWAFRKMIKKYFLAPEMVRQINSYPTLVKSEPFVKTTLITCLMMMLARLLNYVPVDPPARGCIDIAVACALSLGSLNLLWIARPRRKKESSETS